MVIYSYDGSFPGLLTVVFHIYENKLWPDQIVAPGFNGLLFDKAIQIGTQEEQVIRVWEGIRRYGGMPTCEQLFHAYLSAVEGIEMLILEYLKKLFEEKNCIASNFSLDCVLKINQLEKKVLREAQRMLMFARFEQAADGTWFAPLSPKYDVLPLITGHFKLRFSNQSWLIYDIPRGYGFFYNQKILEQVTIDNPTFNRVSGNLKSEVQHPDEDKWQELWKSYFKQIAIAERKNLRCQQNFMPKRFWKHLTEKKI